LEIEPRLPNHVKNAELTRVFRDVTYHITVENNKNDGEVKLEVKGGSANGLAVKADAGTKDVYVKAIVG
jgi:cellobiose phosphorylase